MQTIQINPRLWSLASVRIDDERTLKHGETMKVKDGEWDELKDRRTRQHSSRHQTFILTSDAPPAPEKMQVREADLDTLSKRDLQRAAETLEVSTAGTKVELAARIREALAAAPDSDGDA